MGSGNLGLRFGECEGENGALVSVGAGPDLTAMALYDLSAEGKPNACPGLIVEGVETFEQAEYLFRLGPRV